MWASIPSALKLFGPMSQSSLKYVVCSRFMKIFSSELTVDKTRTNHLNSFVVNFSSNAPNTELDGGSSVESSRRDDMPSTKLLKVALIGRPNAGKSTLINQLVGRHVCPVSMKVHTTRIKARAVQTEGDTQLIYLDTPGLVSSEEVTKFKFELDFLRSGEDALSEADIIGVVIDASNFYEIQKLHPAILRLLVIHYQKESFLILNKIDSIKKKSTLLSVVDKLAGHKNNKKKYPLPERCLSEKEAMELVSKTPVWQHFSEIFMISAMEGDGVGDVKAFLCEKAHPGKWLKPEPFSVPKCTKIISNFVKAGLLDFYPHEIPRSAEVKINGVEILDGNLYAEVLIIAKKETHTKSILKNNFHTFLQMITENINSALEMPCHLKIHVKTRS